MRQARRWRRRLTWHLAWLIVLACGAKAAQVAGADISLAEQRGGGGSGSRGGGGPATAPSGMDLHPPGSERPDVPPRWDFALPPPEEINKSMAFLREVSPRRAEVVARMFDNDRGRFGLRRQIYTRYREMKVLEVEDPPLYQIKLKELRIEDELFGEAAAIRALRQDGHSLSESLRKQIEEHRQKLETAAMEFIELRIAERKHLIAKLQAAVAADERDKRSAARQRIMREINGGGGAGLGGAGLGGELGLPPEALRDGPLAPTTAP
jgi:hypothetical protein